MGLKAKFNLVILAAFVVGLVLTAAYSWRTANQEARDDVLQQAAIMIEAATAIRGYTDTEIAPVLAQQSEARFLPQTIPFFAAATNMRELAKKFPAYSYKEAALNPTNPADKAADWEAAIIDQFRQSATLTTLTTTRDTPEGPVLSIARPIRVSDKSCLVCHSTPQAAPQSMVDLYGSANGFGWALGSVQGAQIVSVPMRVALDRARETFFIDVGGLAVILAITMLLLNLLLHFVVIRPIRTMSALALDVSTGHTDAPEFPVKGHDEIASLAASFNRMRRSLASAIKLLES
jgi:HAMP domain-containing protein